MGTGGSFKMLLIVIDSIVHVNEENMDETTHIIQNNLKQSTRYDTCELMSFTPANPVV
jgi:hypothetical protein